MIDYAVVAVVVLLDAGCSFSMFAELWLSGYRDRRDPFWRSSIFIGLATDGINSESAASLCYVSCMRQVRSYVFGLDAC